LVAAGLAAVMVFSTPNGVRAAGDTQAAWEGFLTNTANPPSACSTVGGTGKADTRVSIFRPHIKASDTPTFLSIVQTRAAISFGNSNETSNPQMNGSGTYNGFGVNSRGKGFSYSGTFSNFVVTPNPVLSTTQVINVTGTLNNYFNTSGCNIKFEAVYVKRID
jgi:hypothetical protein